MKHLAVVLGLLSVFFLQSCQSDGDDAATPQSGVAKLTFDVTNYRQYSMDDETRATSSVSNLSHLVMAVFTTTDSLQTLVEKESSESGYSNFSVELPYGTYVVVFMGYNGTHAIHMASPTNITFSDDYVPNCFYYADTLTVDASTTANQSIILSRAVGCFGLTCKNGIPTEMTAMNYTVTGGGKSFNALTGLASKVETREGTSPVAASVDRTLALSYNIYCFLPSEECKVDVTMNAVDVDGVSIKTRTFTDVPMKRNLRTIYTGDFFKSDINSATAGFNIVLDTYDWNDQSVDF